MAQVNFLHPTQIERNGPRYVRHPGPFAINELDLRKIFPGIEFVQIDPYIGEHVRGDADPPNLRLLCRLVAYQQPRYLLELGTFRGKTTYNFAKHAPQDALVITVDLPVERRTAQDLWYGTDLDFFQPTEKIGVAYRGTEEEPKIRQIFADSTSQRCQDFLDELLQGERLDFVFIDAAHDYESTKHNFENLAYPRMRGGGIIVLDNYGDIATLPGVSHFLQRKAHDEGYVFYWFSPFKSPDATTCVIFPNISEARDYRWKEVTKVAE